MDQTIITNHFSIAEGSWRDLFGVPKAVQQPQVAFLQKELHKIVTDIALPLAAYTLILISTGANNSDTWVQGLKGSEGGPVFIGKMWATEIAEARTRYEVRGKPNTLSIPLAKQSRRVVLRAILNDDTNRSAVGVTTEIKTAFKEALLSKVFE